MTRLTDKEELNVENSVAGGEDREKTLKGTLDKVVAALGSLREEHETTAGGEYKRCGCDLCSAHRRFEDPNVEIERLKHELDLLHDEYENVCQDFDEGLCNGANIRTRLTRAVGFFTSGPTEMAEVVGRALQVALKDPEFESYYSGKVAASRELRIRVLQSRADLRKLEGEMSDLTKRLDALQKTMSARGGADSGVVEQLQSQLADLAKKLEERR